MPRKKPKLDHSVSQIDVGILPKEILCVIFSNLDEKAKQRASETCGLWFELIRNNSNLSSHVFLNRDGLKELQTKIENSEWIWNRWPVLKVLEFGPLSMNIDEPKSVNEALELIKSINFKDCSTLEKIVFSVNFDLQDFFKNFRPKLKIATVEQLTFNPKIFNESFGIEQISVLHIDVDTSVQNYSRLKRFNQNMSEYLNDSIQTVQLTVKYVTMIKYVSNACDFVTDLNVKELTGILLKHGDFEIIPIFQQFKKLRKCQVNVSLRSLEEWHYFEMQGPIILNEKFEDKTEVKFVFTNYFAPIPSRSTGSEPIFEALEVTKMPFEKSVSKLIEVHKSSDN